MLETTGAKHINLNAVEQRIAKHMAKSRYETSRAAGIKNNRKGPQSDYETDLEGFGSELAAAKLLNVWPDLDLDVIPDHDLMFNGKTIDVKSTKYKTGRLCAGLHKVNKSCDYYMLMVGSFPSYRFAGIAAKEELLNQKNIMNLGWGELFALDQDKLNSLKVLKE